MFLLTKALTVIINPLGSSVLLGMMACLLAALGRSKRLRQAAAGFGMVALGWLWLWSSPWASEQLRGAIEAQAGPRELAEQPFGMVAVVLGGGLRGPHPPQRPDPDLLESADRVWHAARLYHAHHIRRIVLSGGHSNEGDGTEADAMQALLLDLGVPKDAILLEDRSTTTAENARFSAELAALRGAKDIVLVTSALHMPRARELFERAGFVVHPAPTDFEVIPVPTTLLSFLPNGESLNGSNRAFKELAGRVVLHFSRH